MARARPLNDLEQWAWQSLQFMQVRPTAELSRQFGANSDLSYPDYLVLVALTTWPDHRPRLFELAHEMGWEKSRLSHHIGRMVQRGLVAREKCDSDRRGAFVMITRSGRRELDAAAPGHAEAVRRLFIDQLSAEQLSVIHDVSKRTIANLTGPPD